MNIKVYLQILLVQKSYHKKLLLMKKNDFLKITIDLPNFIYYLKESGLTPFIPINLIKIPPQGIYCIPLDPNESKLKKV